jgi:hypothetical protein
MGCLKRTARYITALVGRDVKRTFSGGRQFSAGLPGAKTLEPKRQKHANFREPIVCEFPLVHRNHHDRHDEVGEARRTAETTAYDIAAATN